MSSTRSELISLIEQGALSRADAEPAAQASGVLPSSGAWLRFLDRVFLILGGLALGVSLVFFVAYNWFEFGRFAKFALIETAIVVATVVYVFSRGARSASLIGQVSLMVACLSLGALLALYGQTYQTGADPWQLFFNWALLMLPWLLLSRSSWLWLFWCGLINISLLLWLGTYGPPRFLTSQGYIIIMWLVVALNVSFMIVWELASSCVNWLNNRWAIRILGAAVTWLITTIAIGPIFDSEHALVILFVLFIIAGAGTYYRYRKPDLFMLALLALSVSIIALVWLADLLFSTSSDFLTGLFFMCIATLGMGTAASVWLKRVHQHITNSEVTV